MLEKQRIDREPGAKGMSRCAGLSCWCFVLSLEVGKLETTTSNLAPTDGLRIAAQ